MCEGESLVCPNIQFQKQKCLPLGIDQFGLGFFCCFAFVLFYAFLPTFLGVKGVCVRVYRIGHVRSLSTLGGNLRVYS